VQNSLMIEHWYAVAYFSGFVASGCGCPIFFFFFFTYWPKSQKAQPLRQMLVLFLNMVPLLMYSKMYLMIRSDQKE